MLEKLLFLWMLILIIHPFLKIYVKIGDEPDDEKGKKRKEKEKEKEKEKSEPEEPLVILPKKLHHLNLLLFLCFQYNSACI
ncbi:MAG: hypothetical protein CM15mP44_7730 [Candidatus Neomarinimicrobiota bacterium]|nr:MAG: hypothetical protein CM15mP44_7730 [Candidatus Neomarinimicrobiota bacterium]